MVSCLSGSRYTTKNTNGIIYVAEITPLNSFQHYLLHGITTVINRPHFHSLVQLCTVIHVYFDHLCGLQTSEDTPGKFDTRTKVVCTFMCKNNAWIQSMLMLAYAKFVQLHLIGSQAITG